MDDRLRQQLLDMARRDLATRERLAADGSLFDGYNPEMQAVHEENAAALAELIDRHGWPTIARASEDGSEAAWLVAQHAISLPDFCRRCLGELQRAAEAGEVPRWQPAYLEDRIRVYEGRLQRYGISFDWDEQGQLSPRPIEDAEHVDERRASVGLGPLSQAIARHRESAATQPKPADLARRRADMEDWARRTGWRS